jgi:hypothetical protein
MSYEEVIASRADRVAQLEAEIERLKRQHQEELFNAVQQAERPIMAANAKLKRENKFMRYFLERQSRGIPSPDTATSVLSALEKK